MLSLLSGGLDEHQLLHKRALGMALNLLLESNEEGHACGTHSGAAHVLIYLHDPQHSRPSSTS